MLVYHRISVRRLQKGVWDHVYYQLRSNLLVQIAYDIDAETLTLSDDWEAMHSIERIYTANTLYEQRPTAKYLSTKKGLGSIGIIMSNSINSRRQALQSPDSYTLGI